MSKKLKLYVWENVLTDWTHGIIVAYATSEEKARKIIFQKDDYAAQQIENVAPLVVTKQDAFIVHGGG